MLVFYIDSANSNIAYFNTFILGSVSHKYRPSPYNVYIDG